jgi:hypothetical protein
MSEPRGLGVSPETIRRWQDRGLIVPSETPAPIRRSLETGQPSGRKRVNLFPPVIEQSPPATMVESAQKPSGD